MAGGINTYGYAYQNPITNVDVDGRAVWFVIPFFYASSGISITSGQLGMGLITTLLLSDIWTGGDEWNGEITGGGNYGGFTQNEEDDALDFAENLQGWESCALIQEMITTLRNRKIGREIDLENYDECDKGHEERIERIEKALELLEAALGVCT